MATKSGFSKGRERFVDHRWSRNCLGDWSYRISLSPPDEGCDHRGSRQRSPGVAWVQLERNAGADSVLIHNTSGTPWRKAASLTDLWRRPHLLSPTADLPPSAGSSFELARSLAPRVTAHRLVQGARRSG